MMQLEWLCKDLIVRLTSNIKLSQKGEHQSKTLEVSSSILAGGNILLLKFFWLSYNKAYDANIAKFVQFVKNSFTTDTRHENVDV